MKKYITYAMTALFATIAVSIAAPDKDAMMAKETAAWQAFKDKKSDDFKKVVHADFRGVYVEGTYDGKDASGTYNAGSVWTKHKGEWQAIFHTNVKGEKPASP